MWSAEVAATWHLLACLARITARLIFGQRKHDCKRNEECDAPTMKCHLRMIHAVRKNISYRWRCAFDVVGRFGVRSMLLRFARLNQIV